MIGVNASQRRPAAYDIGHAEYGSRCQFVYPRRLDQQAITMSDVTTSARSTPRWAKSMLIVAVLSTALLAIGPLGYRFGLLPLGAGLLLPVGGLALAAMVVLIGLATLAFILKPGREAARVPVLMSMAIAALIVLVMGMQLAAARSAPPIHDISTDLADPPQFQRISELRAASDNSLEFDPAKLAEPTRTAYPRVQPINTPLAPDAAMARALQVAESLGWEIVASDPARGVIEATETTFWYGFKDDVVIRIRATGSGSRIDLRSASRVGLSDLGANARRIGQFIEAFESA